MFALISVYRISEYISEYRCGTTGGERKDVSINLEAVSGLFGYTS